MAKSKNNLSGESLDSLTRRRNNLRNVVRSARGSALAIARRENNAVAAELRRRNRAGKAPKAAAGAARGGKKPAAAAKANVGSQKPQRIATTARKAVDAAQNKLKRANTNSEKRTGGKKPPAADKKPAAAKKKRTGVMKRRKRKA